MTLIILASSIDDFFVDCWYWLRELYRWYWIKPNIRPSRSRRSKPRPNADCDHGAGLEGADVIQAMLNNQLPIPEYTDYKFFVGVYQNDAEHDCTG